MGGAFGLCLHYVVVEWLDLILADKFSKFNLLRVGGV